METTLCRQLIALTTTTKLNPEKTLKHKIGKTATQLTLVKNNTHNTNSTETKTNGYLQNSSGLHCVNNDGRQRQQKLAAGRKGEDTNHHTTTEQKLIG